MCSSDLDTTLRDGDVTHIFWSADNASVTDLEAAAEALLTTAAQVRTENGATCPGCAERGEVLRAALALLSPHAAALAEGMAPTQPRHLH